MDIKELHKRFASCPCGREHNCDIAEVKIGHGVINEIGELCAGYEKILLVSDENTYKYAKGVESILSEKTEKYKNIQHLKRKISVLNFTNFR